MKSPQQLAGRLVLQWQRSDWREQHLLSDRDAWPLRLSIGEPCAARFRDDSTALREHLQQWRAVAAHGPGLVEWSARQYRAGATPVEIPTQWTLRPSDCPAVFEQLADGNSGTQASTDYRALTHLLPQVDAHFYTLLVRRLALWRHLDVAQVVAAAHMALQLEPGCAEGRPLRALALAGNDSKFFERHAALLTAMLDERFEGEASRQGLTAFLGAASEGEHWLLVVPLAPGLLPFQRQRVPASELQTVALPSRRILLVENERCLYQLPNPTPDTIAILGAGLNLGWLCAPWLQTRHVAYWGDLDTWGLAMLAQARRALPQLHALLMDDAIFAAHQDRAVPEPVHAPTDGTEWLLPAEAALDRCLRTLPAGRLEQEFLPPAAVSNAIDRWLDAG